MHSIFRILPFVTKVREESRLYGFYQMLHQISLKSNESWGRQVGASFKWLFLFYDCDVSVNLCHISTVEQYTCDFPAQVSTKSADQGLDWWIELKSPSAFCLCLDLN